MFRKLWDRIQHKRSVDNLTDVVNRYGEWMKEWLDKNGGARSYLAAYINYMSEPGRFDEWSAGTLREAAPFQTMSVRMVAMATRMILSDGKHALDDEEEALWLERAETTYWLAAGQLEESCEKRMKEIAAEDPALTPAEVAIAARSERVDQARRLWSERDWSGGNVYNFKL